MIELRTGVPGSGKTLSMVERLAALFHRWQTHPEEVRPVFVLGIPDLAFPVSEVPLKFLQINKAGSPSLVPDWDSMPDGSLVLIDEAQGVFPPRSSASQSPVHVAWLNTHRHKGFDIWLTTQHPKLIDATVRALVGKHQHFRRLFGGSRAMVYEWDSCSDNLSGTKSAITSYWPYPKKAFKWYKSAEIHTKQEFKYPKWLLIPVIGLAMALFFVPRAYSVMFGEHKTAAEYIPQDSSQTKQQAASGVSAAAHAAADTPLEGFPVLHENSKDVSASTLGVQPDNNLDRPVERIRLADGVYSDSSELPAPLTDLQKERLRKAVLALEHLQAQGRFVPDTSSLKVAEND